MEMMGKGPASLGATDATDALESDLPSGLSHPARRALIATGCVRLDQVARLSEQEILQLHGVGPKAVKLLRPALDAQGLTFAREDRTSS